MFNKIFKKDKKAAKEEEKRAAECREALEGVLRAFHCELKPVLYTTPHGILPDIQICPLELPKNELGRPGAEPGATGAAVTGKATTEAPKTDQAQAQP